jgi:hypothetical protein
MQWDNTITSIFNWLSSLSWPIAVFFIFLILKSPISWLLTHLKSIRWKDWIFEIGDKVPVYSPTDNKFHEVVLQPPIPAAKVKAEKIARLSDEEIEQSRIRAQQRLDEDTKRAGYQRGKLFQVPDSGKWAIAWEIEVNAGIVLKDSAKK